MVCYIYCTSGFQLPPLCETEEEIKHTFYASNHLPALILWCMVSCQWLHIWMFVFLITFSLVLSSSNISWISTRQSSCMLWKESWGIVAITASSMADSCSRMQEKEGRTWGSWSQHSGHTQWRQKALIVVRSMLFRWDWSPFYGYLRATPFCKMTFICEELL